MDVTVFEVHVKLFSVKRTPKKLITLAVPPLPYWWKVGVENHQTVKMKVML